MDEHELEKKVGDILTRKRTIAKLLTEDCKETAYGPLTLRLTNNNTILPTDLDGRVYETIKIPNTNNTEKQVNHVLTEADDRMEQLHNEL